MKVVRPSSFIPYGPHGHPAAKFHLEYEGPELELVTERFWQERPDLSVNFTGVGMFADRRKALAEDGYYILPVVNEEVPAEQVAELEVPQKYVPAAPGVKGRRLEDFPHTVPGYYQHYDYTPLVTNSPECDHDFGLESVDYVYVTENRRELLPMEKIRRETCSGVPSPAGNVYLTVKCTRCGDVHGLEQQSADGHLDLHFTN